MDAKKSIAYLDDEPANLKIIQRLLEAEYKISCFHNSEEFLAANYLHADLLLLDVNLPSISGYQVCKEIRENAYDKPVLFLSAHSHVEDRLKGYQAGGDDYLGKPFNIDELKLKIKNNLESYAYLQKTKNALKLASSTAMAAMNTASEMGVALLFTQKTHLSENTEQLAASLKDALRSYGLNCVFCFRIGPQRFYKSTCGAQLSQLEKELLDAYQRVEKIVTHGQRCLLSAEKISILAKNMPKDLEKTGRLRDHLALIHDTSHQHLNFLSAKNQQQELQKTFIDELRHHTQQIVANIDATATLSRERVETIVEDIKQELFGLELKLDLDEEHTEILQSISSELQKSLDEIVDDFDTIEQQINILIDAIQNYQRV